MNRVHVVKTVLWSLVGLGLAVAVTRFAFGLGATTNLTDTTPWGIWIGFDVMAGVALAAGGFIMTAIFYILRQEKYHPLVRPAVLTAFLGYLAVVFSLLVDLGLPWNIWHMLIYWNPHSPLFEVGWCVMLYTTVLLLEFSPVPLEETSRYAKIRSFLLKFRFPLVLLGIMLSTLHQSSLGSLFLITPFKSHALWYTGLLPILFFISAVALGLCMVSFESLATGWVYRRKPETNLVAGLCRAAFWVLAVYLVVRLGDIIIQGKFAMIFEGSWESSLFVAELLILAIIPMVLFGIRRFRYSQAGQWIGAFMVVFGAIFNRINVGGLTMMSRTGDFYFPSWMEFSVTFGVISFMALIFMFGVEHFHIWEKRPREREAEPHAAPEFSRAGEVWLGAPAVASRTKYSFAFVAALAIGFALIPGKKIKSGGVEHVPAQPARGGDTLFIDGNRDGYGVSFKHEMHVDKNGQKQSCVLCHHMNLPMDKQSRCTGCHRDQYSAVNAFDHDWHSSPTGGNIACNNCHQPGLNRSAETAKKCDACHKDLVAPGSTIKIESYIAPSYVDAMHDLCIECHIRKVAELPDKPDLPRCATCHQSAPPDYLQADVRRIVNGPQYNHVVLPGVKYEPEKQASP
jgi:Ni/Fe-hydrogenase subunit HybB-like protein